MEYMIRILIVGYNPLIGTVLSAVLEDEPDIHIVGEAKTTSKALKLAPSSDVILVNIEMPNDGAFKLIRSLAATGIPAKALVMGLAESKKQILHYIQAGAAGYVLKSDSMHVLLERIRGIDTGQVLVSPKIASALMTRLKNYARMLNRVRASAPETPELTQREIEILDLISQGHTNQQIASQLVIELGTVKNHVHNILQKMDASTRQEAAANWVIFRADANASSQLLE